MSMAHRPVATSQWQAVFYVHHQTFKLVITPPVQEGNFAPDSFITHLHKIYAFILPALLGMLQVQGAGGTVSPFQVHPVTTGASLFGMLGYYLAFMAWLRVPLYSTQLSIAMTAFGSFSLASLVTLLLPQSWWHIRYVFYVLLAVVDLHRLLIVLYERYVRRFMLTMRRSWAPNSARHLLPLTNVDLRVQNNAYLMGAPAESATIDFYPL